MYIIFINLALLVLNTYKRENLISDIWVKGYRTTLNSWLAIGYRLNRHNRSYLIFVSYSLCNNLAIYKWKRLPVNEDKRFLWIWINILCSNRDVLDFFIVSVTNITSTMATRILYTFLRACQLNTLTLELTWKQCTSCIWFESCRAQIIHGQGLGTNTSG